MNCINCGKTLLPDELGATKMAIGKQITDYYCLQCLAERMKTTPEWLQARIDFLRERGCVLFPK